MRCERGYEVRVQDERKKTVSWLVQTSLRPSGSRKLEDSCVIYGNLMMVL
jgi:hypothetical protein